MRKNLIILIICLVFLFSVSGCFFNKTPSSVETTAAVSESDLTQKIELKGITYYIPADFQTIGKNDAVILRHINTNGDNLLVSYLGDFDDSNMDIPEKHIELGSLAISFVKSSDGIDPDYDYKTIDDLAVVKTTYTTKDTYNITYHFFANKGAYCMSYSSKEPISESNDKLLEKIVETVTPSANSTEALTTEKITEKPTEPPTEKKTEPVTEKEPESKDDSVPLEYRNALKSAESYLSHSAFSKDGLYDQLKYEKYSDDAASYAVNNVNTDWNENALKSAESYMSHSSFSKEGLYDQLVYEKFTNEQARYAVDNINVDWKEAAVKTAESYLRSSSFSKEELYDQLIYEKYTPEEAQYAVDKVYN